MTCYQEITCPKCAGNNIAKSGLSAHGVQRYRCRHLDCPTKTFMLNYRYRAHEPGIKEQAVDIVDTVAPAPAQHLAPAKAAVPA